MHFNLAKFLYGVLFGFLLTSTIYALSLMFWPVKQAFKLAFKTTSACIAAALYPMKQGIKAYRLKKNPPKCYRKLRPAHQIPTLSTRMVLKPVAAAPTQFKERHQLQTEQFLRQFAGVVQYGA